MPLRAIVTLGSHILVCRKDLMVDHVYLFTRTLAEHKDAIPARVGMPVGVVPAHRGSRAFFAGERMSIPAGTA